MEKPVLTSSEAAERVGVTTATLMRWIADGHGPRVLRTPGRHVRIRLTDMEQWINVLASPRGRE